MSVNAYSKDSDVRVTTTFTVANVASDPSTVKCYYKDPTGAITALTYGADSALVKDSTGNYHVDIFANKPGTWFYRFEGTGAVIAANEAQFYIEQSNIL